MSTTMILLICSIALNGAVLAVLVVVLLAHRAWLRRFGSEAPDVAAQPARVSGSGTTYMTTHATQLMLKRKPDGAWGYGAQREARRYGVGHHPGEAAAPGSATTDLEADLPVLTLPDNPTADDVKAALYELEKTFAGRSSVSSIDLPVSTFDAIPIELLPAALEIGRHSMIGFMLEESAAERLTEADKEIVLRAFGTCGALGAKILEYGWLREVEPVLLNLLTNEGRSALAGPSDVLATIVERLDSDRVWEAAAARLRANPEYLFGVRSLYRNQRFREIVGSIWQENRHRFRIHEMIAADAIACGVMDALAFGVEVAPAARSGHLTDRLFKAIYQHTEFDGPVAEAAAWFDQVKTSLRFDPESGMFTTQS